MDITLKNLVEEFDAIKSFIYYHHMDEWKKYCDEHRNGNMSLEHFAMLMTSLTNARPWRFIVDSDHIERLVQGVTMYLTEIKGQMERNEQDYNSEIGNDEDAEHVG